MARLISTRSLTFATIMGALALAMQIYVPGIPMGMGKIELADLPAVQGAAFSGLIGGVLIGFLFGLGSGVPLAAILASPISFALLGYLSKNLKMKWVAIPIVYGLVYPSIMAILVKIFYYGAAVPLFVILLRSLWYCVPTAIISVPLYIFIEKKIPGTHLLG